jgi:hypothetical protein
LFPYFSLYESNELSLHVTGFCMTGEKISFASLTKPAISLSFMLFLYILQTRTVHTEGKIVPTNSKQWEN